MEPAIPQCGSCGGALRPDIVWFGEIPYFLDEIDKILKKVDYFLVVGTSGSVQPAASLVYIAKRYDATTIGVNLAEPENMLYIDEFHKGRSGEILPDLVNMWIG
jgi:NAD-dependent deacetylase